MATDYFVLDGTLELPGRGASMNITWQEDDIWTAHDPDVPGAYGLGNTETEAESDLQDALQTNLEYLREAQA